MEESSLEILSQIGTQLGRLARPNKDFLIKSLRQAVNALAKIEQPLAPESSKKTEAVKKLEAVLKPITKAVTKHGLLRHSDKDVKLLVAICVTEFFRILAPEPPFEDKYLRDVFKLILSMFAELGDITSPYFSKRVKILETVARCKCFLLLLDIGCSDLVLEMFNIFFSIVRENHQRSLIHDILSIMTHILNEEASQSLSEVVLRNLVKEGTAASIAASQLAVSVLESCSEKLEPFVCGFLTSCLLDRDAVDSELKEFYHEILFKAFQCAPQMLLAVIPNLTQELLTDQVDVRIKAVNLVGKLFALPEQHVAQKYHNLFIEFKNRFSDKSVEVRLSAIQCAKACYMAIPSRKESLELLSALEGRLLDFDDRVRTLAVVVVCDLARFNMKSFPPELLLKSAERLRDKKVSVRKKALQKLIEVYQEYCNKCCEGYLTISDDFEQIPCKIVMLCYDKDCKEFRIQNMELILAEDLFPACLSVEDRTKHWIHFFSLFTPLHEKALNSILSQKRRLQNEMKNCLALRKKEKESSSEEMQKKIKSSIMKISASFPEPSRAEECFLKLNQVKNGNIFNSLELLLVEQTITKSQEIRDKLLKMIGDKHPHFEFLQLLSSKCSHNLFSSEHVCCILEHVSGVGFANESLEASAAKLLLVIISAFPSLLRGSEQQFRLLLEEKKLISDMLIEALAKAGPYISVEFSDFYPLLEKVCLEGTRIQSKHAVSAIASLVGSSGQFIFSKLCKELLEALHRGWNTPTILQSLGCIAQHSVSAFEDQYGEIRVYILEQIFQVEQSYNLILSDKRSDCCPSCKLKIYGLKTLVKSFLPHRGSHINRQIDELLDILLKLLQTGDAFGRVISCVNDKPLMRLAAAKSVLRLSKRWDLHVSPEMFRSTILIAKDSSLLVRKVFLNKTFKLLKEHLAPSRYACAFALAACEDLHDAALKYMEEYIKEYNTEARMHQNSASEGGTVTDHPAYLVVFLIHTLAHDIGFPSEDSWDEQVLANFCRPLFWIIHALLNANFVNGDMDIVNDAVMYLLSIFRAVKRAEDAVDAAKTPKLQVLADIGISSVNALNLNGFTFSRAPPGMIFLPSSLYRLSSVKKHDEDNLISLNQSPLDGSFVRKVVSHLKSQIPMQASSLPKRSRKCQEDVMLSSHNMLNLALADHANSSRLETTEMSKPPRQNISLGRRKKCAASKSVELNNDVSKNHASKSSKSILQKGFSSSCDSVTTRSVNKSQVLSQGIDGNVLKENDRVNSSINAESSKHPTMKRNEPCCSRTFSTQSEVLIGKRIKLLSPIDRCFCSGTVIGFNPSSNTHKVSYDSGEVELLCLDSESWETLGDNSPLEKEMTTADDNNTSHSSDCELIGCSSLINLEETVNTFGDGATAQSKQLTSKENREVSNLMTSFPAKGKKERKVLSKILASESTNVDDDAFVRRTRRRKG